MAFPGGTPIAPRGGIGAGVLGGWCQAEIEEGPATVFITNSHALTNKKVDMEVVGYPGPKVFATLYRWAEKGKRIYDVAICRPIEETSVDPSIEAMGQAVYLLGDPEVGMQVRLYSTTRKAVLKGRITAIDRQTKHYDSLNDFLIAFPNEAGPQHGDSGSLIALDDNKDTLTIVGLYWGTASKFDHREAAHPIVSVFKEWRLAAF